MPVSGTNVHVPTPRRRLVQRARLLDRLEARAGLMPRLVLVSAAAGFGKTTLLTQWLSQAGTSAVAGALLRLSLVAPRPRPLNHEPAGLVGAPAAPGPRSPRDQP